jgi:2-polyprenyl-6-methoxyphenol hydroxylase-like FAD-dependent oxidoreductase
MAPEIVDVAIVGYGPVGQLLAILLGQRGWKVRVLERWPEPYPLPRAVHLDHEVARILQGAGVIDALLPRTEAASIYEWRNADGDVLIRIGRDAERSLSGWPESLMFCQPELERILDERVRALPSVQVEWGCEVVGVRDAGDHVELDTRRGHDDTRSVRARFAVGCDGARSFVRGVVDPSWHDLGFAFDWLVIDVIPREARAWDPMNWQLCDPARPTTAVSGGPGRRRWEFMRLPHETLDELNSEAAAWRLLEPWEIRPDNAQLERHAVYTFRGAWADAWRKGRILLAGDAAHLTPPFVGQGLCSGMRDAANLAWKLDLVLAGRAAEPLLDSYTSERLPHVRALIEFAVSLGRVICVSDPAEAAERDRRMIAEQRERKEAVAAELPVLGPGCFVPGRDICSCRTACAAAAPPACSTTWWAAASRWRARTAIRRARSVRSSPASSSRSAASRHTWHRTDPSPTSPAATRAGSASRASRWRSSDPTTPCSEPLRRSTAQRSSSPACVRSSR